MNKKIKEFLKKVGNKCPLCGSILKTYTYKFTFMQSKTIREEVSCILSRKNNEYGYTHMVYFVDNNDGTLVLKNFNKDTVIIRIKVIDSYKYHGNFDGWLLPYEKFCEKLDKTLLLC